MCRGKGPLLVGSVTGLPTIPPLPAKKQSSKREFKRAVFSGLAEQAVGDAYPEG